jgi:CPA1 family monovalent cation:H+ antiporter
MLGHVAFVLAMIAVILLARMIADRLNVPYTIVLTLCGLVYAALPGPNLHLDPDVLLVLVIPPLLYSAALRSSLLAIRANWRPIISLSVVLVLLTAFAVGGLISLVVPRVTLAAGLVLGSAVAPTDPVAALSIGRRAAPPPRLLTVIGAGIGYLLRLARPLFREPLLATTVSLATPFAAYVAGEAAHMSGVLAVVIAGLMASHHSPSEESGPSRLQIDAVWRLVDFLLEGLVFLFIGQQLPAVLRGLKDEPAGVTAAAIVLTLLAVLLIRPAWLFLTQTVPGWLGWRFGDPNPTLTGREATAVTWAGTRGVITLAAIFSVPLLTSSGRPFPDRDLMQLCAYLVVLVTLVG